MAYLTQKRNLFVKCVSHELKESTWRGRVSVYDTHVANYGATLLGGRIDMGHHEGRAKLALYDTLAFSDAVGMADRMTSEDDTLIVTTADHAHVMSIAGYPSRGNPILGKFLLWYVSIQMTLSVLALKWFRAPVYYV